MEWNSSNKHFSKKKFVVVLTTVAMFTSAIDSCPTASGVDCTCFSDGFGRVECVVTSSVDSVGMMTESSTSYAEVTFKPETVNANSVSKLTSGFLSNILITKTLRATNLKLKTLEKGCLKSKENAIISVNLERNAITDIPAGLFYDTQNVEEINLNLNALSTIESGIFSGLSNLKYIRLKRNQISSIHPSAFVDLPSLDELHLLENKLTSMPKFGSLYSLKFLDLSSNNIPTLPDDAFNNLPNLHQLFINNNNMQSIPTNSFKSLTKLEELNLMSNTLADIPAKAFQGLDSVNKINLGFAGIRRISYAAFDDVSDHLIYVDLSGNNLEELCYTPFRCLATTVNLAIGRNKFKCDCGLSWIRKFSETKQQKCASPDTSQDISTFPVDNCPLANTDLGAICRGEKFYDCSGQIADSLPVDEIPPKTPPENPPKTPPETPPENPPETPPETLPENPPETPPENPPENPPETPPENPPEMKPETPPENPPETPPDTPPENPPETSPETPPENPPETPPENPPEIKPETPPENPPETRQRPDNSITSSSGDPYERSRTAIILTTCCLILFRN